MLWLTILAALLVAVLAILYVAWPLWWPAQSVLLDDDSPLAHLIQRKDSLLLSIKELEFDQQTGKLSVDDFQRFDQRLRHQAIALLRQIEQAAPHAAGLEAELEAAIQRQRRVTTPVTVNGQKPGPLHCPQCQTDIRPTDKFCPHCGHALAQS